MSYQWNLSKFGSATGYWKLESASWIAIVIGSPPVPTTPLWAPDCASSHREKAKELEGWYLVLQTVIHYESGRDIIFQVISESKPQPRYQALQGKASSAYRRWVAANFLGSSDLGASAPITTRCPSGLVIPWLGLAIGSPKHKAKRPQWPWAAEFHRRTVHCATSCAPVGLGHGRVLSPFSKPRFSAAAAAAHTTLDIDQGEWTRLSYLLRKDNRFHLDIAKNAQYPEH